MRRNYKELERAYTQAVNELNDIKETKVGGMEQATENKYREELDWALSEAEKYKEMVDHLSKEGEELELLNNQLKNQKDNLERMLESKDPEGYQQDYEEFKREINERDHEIHELNVELKQLIDRYDYLVETHNALEAQIEKGEFQIPNQQNQQQINYNAELEEELKHLKNKIHDAESKERSIQALSD